MTFGGEDGRQMCWQFDLGKMLEASKRNHHSSLEVVEKIALHIKQVGSRVGLATGVGIDIETRHQKLFHSSSGKPSMSTVAL